MTYYVYVLICLNSPKNFTYVGCTSNLKNRLNLHNTSRGAKFTKGRLWKIIYKKRYKNKSTALKNEYLLKKNKKKRLQIKLNYLEKNEYSNTSAL